MTSAMKIGTNFSDTEGGKNEEGSGKEEKGNMNFKLISINKHDKQRILLRFSIAICKRPT